MAKWHDDNLLGELGQRTAMNEHTYLQLVIFHVHCTSVGRFLPCEDVLSP